MDFSVTDTKWSWMQYNYVIWLTIPSTLYCEYENKIIFDFNGTEKLSPNIC